jgi:hypothetical protein
MLQVFNAGDNWPADAQSMLTIVVLVAIAG